MRLYTTGRGHWAGTQADARKLKKRHGTSCDMHEVPVDKKGLLDFLNGNAVTTDVVAQVPVAPRASHDVPKHAPVDDVTERSSDKEAFIGKTTIMVGGFFHKLHCYYYTENWEDR